MVADKLTDVVPSELRLVLAVLSREKLCEMDSDPVGGGSFEMVGVPDPG